VNAVSSTLLLVLFGSHLLYQKCHRRCFVQQPQFAIGVLDVGRIPKDSSVLQGSVDVTDHRSDVSAGVARFRVSLFVQSDDGNLQQDNVCHGDDDVWVDMQIRLSDRLKPKSGH